LYTQYGLAAVEELAQGDWACEGGQVKAVTSEDRRGQCDAVDVGENQGLADIPVGDKN